MSGGWEESSCVFGLGFASCWAEVSQKLVSATTSGQSKGQCDRGCVCEIKARPGALLWGPCSISIGNRPDRPRWRATGLPEARLSFFWGTQLKQFLHWEKHPCVLYRLYAVFSILRPVVRAGLFWSVGQLLGRSHRSGNHWCYSYKDPSALLSPEALQSIFARQSEAVFFCMNSATLTMKWEWYFSTCNSGESCQDSIQSYPFHAAHNTRLSVYLRHVSTTRSTFLQQAQKRCMCKRERQPK